MKRMILIFVILIVVAGCSNSSSNESSLQNVGLILPAPINDQVWNTKGYQGLLNIESSFGVKTFYRENVKTENEVRSVLNTFQKENVNLVFGHGYLYANLFSKVSGDYPMMHFVAFNGDARDTRVTSLHFKGKAMGFFGGMVAGAMSETNQIGIVAAFPWQPEVEGFQQGVAYKNPEAEVTTVFTKDWNDEIKAISEVDKMITEHDVDVVYPAGDGYNVPVIREVKRLDRYAVGYVSDQSSLGKETVLTSTVQHVDALYVKTAEQFQRGELPSGNLYYDFQDNVISLGKFSPRVPEELKQEVEQAVVTYKETGELPTK